MPNVSWQEPQILLDLLAMNLYAEKNGMQLGGPKEVVVVSPWLSDVEILLRPGTWHQQLTLGEVDTHCTLRHALGEFLRRGWKVSVAVLAYGAAGLFKKSQEFRRERELLRALQQQGALVYLIPDLHAKGLVTPLAILTGSTNLTKAGLFAQSQNASFFSHDHLEYSGNRTTLLGKLQNSMLAHPKDLAD
jgi:phosphatidylserine/phosphatidylglycerophosphate/cardiolipin synthase-like enzyme